MQGSRSPIGPLLRLPPAPPLSTANWAAPHCHRSHRCCPIAAVVGCDPLACTDIASAAAAALTRRLQETPAHHTRARPFSAAGVLAPVPCSRSKPGAPHYGHRCRCSGGEQVSGRPRGSLHCCSMLPIACMQPCGGLSARRPNGQPPPLVPPPALPLSRWLPAVLPPKQACARGLHGPHGGQGVHPAAG